MTKKSILFIVGGSYVSGAERVSLDVLEGLKKAGHSLFCITSEWTDNDFQKRLSKLGVGFLSAKLGWYYFSNLKWSLDSLLNYPRSYRKLSTFFKSRNYDLLYTISFRFIILLYPLLRKNIIYHVHDPNSHSMQSRFFLRLTDSKILSYFAVSDFIKADLIKCGIDPSKISVVHNGVDLLEVRRPNAEPDLITLGIIGQIIPRKGHEDVIAALKILRDKKIETRLVIAGKGDPKFVEKLKHLIEKSDLAHLVNWRGFKDNIYDIYQGVDIVVAPTRNDEPFALIALEACALSIPVIASRKGGFPESIEDGVNGFLVDAYNPKELAEKISIFYFNKKIIREFGNNGRKIVVDHFSKDKMISKIQKLIQQQ